MALITRYINTDATSGGDGTTDSTTGVNRAYNSLAAAEAAEQVVYGDLVADGNSIEFVCSGTGLDTTNVVMADWITSETNNITVRPHSNDVLTTAIWNNSYYRRKVTISWGLSLYLTSEYISIEGIQIELAASNTTGIRLISRGTIAKNCIVKGSNGIQTGINAGGDGLRGSIVVNNIVYDCGGYGIRNQQYLSGVGSYLAIYNNTVNNCGNGLHLNSNSVGTDVRIVNNLLTNNTTDYYSISTPTFTAANVTSDATSPDSGFGNKTIEYTDEQANDYATSDVDVVGTGVDLSLDPLYAFNTDIEDTLRGTSWNVGATHAETIVRFRSAGIGDYITTGTTLNPLAPAGVTVGDLLILTTNISTASQDPETPAGWIRLDSLPYWFSNGEITIFWKVADGTAGDTPTVTLSTTPTKARAFILRFDGVDTSNPISSYNSFETGSSPIDIPSATVVNNGSMAVVIGGSYLTETGTNTYTRGYVGKFEANPDLFSFSAVRRAESGTIAQGEITNPTGLIRCGVFTLVLNPLVSGTTIEASSLFSTVGSVQLSRQALLEALLVMDNNNVVNSTRNAILQSASNLDSTYGYFSTTGSNIEATAILDVSNNLVTAVGSILNTSVNFSSNSLMVNSVLGVLNSSSSYNTGQSILSSIDKIINAGINLSTANNLTSTISKIINTSVDLGISNEVLASLGSIINASASFSKVFSDISAVDKVISAISSFDNSVEMASVVQGILNTSVTLNNHIVLFNTLGSIIDASANFSEVMGMLSGLNTSLEAVANYSSNNNLVSSSNKITDASSGFGVGSGLSPIGNSDLSASISLADQLEINSGFGSFINESIGISTSHGVTTSTIAELLASANESISNNINLSVNANIEELANLIVSNSLVADVGSAIDVSALISTTNSLAVTGEKSLEVTSSYIQSCALASQVIANLTTDASFGITANLIAQTNAVLLAQSQLSTGVDLTITGGHLIEAYGTLTVTSTLSSSGIVSSAIEFAPLQDGRNITVRAQQRNVSVMVQNRNIKVL